MRLFYVGYLVVALIIPVRSQTLVDPNLQLEPFTAVGALSYPINMAFVSENEILVTEKSGRVKRVVNGEVIATPALTRSVTALGEDGMLGIALDPSFPEVPHVYIFYSVRDRPTSAVPLVNRVARFTWTGTSLIDEFVVIDLPPSPSANHLGGIIRFGPPDVAPVDQKLFIVVGDLRAVGRQTVNISSGLPPDFTAMVIRINRDGSSPTDGPFYSIADGNVATEVMFAYGIRNSFGMDFDPITNVLWNTENGSSSYDEINRVESAFNSGWHKIMGPVGWHLPWEEPPAPPELWDFNGVGVYSDPEFTFGYTVAPTAIHFFRGNGLGPHYKHDCFVGAYRYGKVYRFTLNGDRTGFHLTDELEDKMLNGQKSDEQIVFAEGFGVITDIVTGPDGLLYLLDMSGTIYRVSSTASIPAWEIY